MKLFDNKERSDVDHAYRNENIYDFIDRSALSELSAIREILNNWFMNYPDCGKSEIKNRFKKTFSSAFYELFIHELFKCQGFKIRIHPEVPNSTKRPDFLLSKNDCEFYLEAKEVNDKTNDERALENKLNEFYDSIDKSKSPNFFLNIEELLLKTSRQPSTKKIIETIEKETIKYNPDDISNKIKLEGYDQCPKINYEDENIKAIISLIPKDRYMREVDDRPLGVIPGELFIGGSEESIRKSFLKKAKRYGQLDKPYIICINAIGNSFAGIFAADNAIWGSQALTWSTNPNNPDERMTRVKNGVFLNERGFVNRNVNGILITSIAVFSINSSSHWLAKHPYPEKKLDFNVFELAYQFAEDKKIKMKEGKSIGEILNNQNA